MLSQAHWKGSSFGSMLEIGTIDVGSCVGGPTFFAPSVFSTGSSSGGFVVNCSNVLATYRLSGDGSAVTSTTMDSMNWLSVTNPGTSNARLLCALRALVALSMRCPRLQCSSAHHIDVAVRSSSEGSGCSPLGSRCNCQGMLLVLNPHDVAFRDFVRWHDCLQGNNTGLKARCSSLTQDPESSTTTYVLNGLLGCKVLPKTASSSLVPWPPIATTARAARDHLTTRCATLLEPAHVPLHTHVFVVPTYGHINSNSNTITLPSLLSFLSPSINVTLQLRIVPALSTRLLKRWRERHEGLQ